MFALTLTSLFTIKKCYYLIFSLHNSILLSCKQKIFHAQFAFPMFMYRMSSQKYKKTVSTMHNDKCHLNLGEAAWSCRRLKKKPYALRAWLCLLLIAISTAWWVVEVLQPIQCFDWISREKNGDQLYALNDGALDFTSIFFLHLVECSGSSDVSFGLRHY